MVHNGVEVLGLYFFFIVFNPCVFVKYLANRVDLAKEGVCFIPPPPVETSIGDRAAREVPCYAEENLFLLQNRMASPSLQGVECLIYYLALGMKLSLSSPPNIAWLLPPSDTTAHPVHAPEAGERASHLRQNLASCRGYRDCCFFFV